MKRWSSWLQCYVSSNVCNTDHCNSITAAAILNLCFIFQVLMFTGLSVFVWQIKRPNRSCRGQSLPFTSVSTSLLLRPNNLLLPLGGHLSVSTVSATTEKPSWSSMSFLPAQHQTWPHDLTQLSALQLRIPEADASTKISTATDKHLTL